MRYLTETEFTVAKALVAHENLGRTQYDIGAEFGLHPMTVSLILEAAVQVLGIPDEAGAHVRRQRLAIASHRAGGLDRLAAATNLRIRESKQ